MSGTSYLLSIDGSEESRLASYFAWELAKETGARVVAQHVVDTTAVWQLLSYGQSGFIGSGIYMEARETITAALASIAEALMLSYTSQIDGQSLQFETIIDEGDPLTEIIKRAPEHDLVIIARHRRDIIANPKWFEKLVQACQCSILIFGSADKRWSEMRIFIEKDLECQKDVSSLYQFGTMLGLPARVFIDTTVLQSAEKRFELGGWSQALGVRSIERSSLDELIGSAPEDALLAVSSNLLAGQGSAEYRSRLLRFLDQSKGSGLLIWDKKQLCRPRLRLAS